jgi:hypothetical protein
MQLAMGSWQWAKCNWQKSKSNILIFTKCLNNDIVLPLKKLSTFNLQLSTLPLKKLSTFNLQLSTLPLKKPSTLNLQLSTALF